MDSSSPVAPAPRAPDPRTGEEMGPPITVEPMSSAQVRGPDVGEAAASNEAVEATESPRRSLKLVLSLTPDDAGGYRAFLAVGADGCDPLLRSVDVVDVTTALHEVARLITAAQARWQIEPRNPPAPKKSGGKVAHRPGTKQLPGEQPQEPGRESPDPEPVPTGQLTLFG